MAEYVAFDPEVEIKGSAVLVVMEAIGDQSIPIMEKHGLANIKEDEWYSQQTYLDAFRELAEIGFLTLVSVGMKIPDVADFPPIESVEEALQLLDVAYHMNHRGGDIGEYRLEEIHENSAVMICQNPYPSDFDYGIIYRLVQKYRPSNSKNLTVTRLDDPPNRQQGGDACTYVIEW